MALELRATSAFQMDLRRIRKRGKDLDKLEGIVNTLQAQGRLPTRCRPHPLRGKWIGYWDCHVEPDWILLYRLTEEALILVRTGSHADLFGS
jgi:mRNA interferase YafQ